MTFTHTGILYEGSCLWLSLVMYLQAFHARALYWWKVRGDKELSTLVSNMRGNGIKQKSLEAHKANPNKLQKQ